MRHLPERGIAWETGSPSAEGKAGDSPHGVCLGFASLSLYMTATAITGFGGGNGATEMRHIEKLDLPVQESDNLYNNVYGNEKRTEE